jgi:cephalosporin hydroxylase
MNELDIEDLVRNKKCDQYVYMLFMMPILLDVHVLVETGLGAGESTRAHIEALSQMSSPREMHSYEIHPETDYTQNVINHIKSRNYPVKWEIHAQDSVEGAHNWSGPKIDYLYLDSDHAYQHVLNEVNAFAPHLSEKAIVITEDTWPYKWEDFTEQQRKEILSTRNNGERPCNPYWALYDFAQAHGWKGIDFKQPPDKFIIYRA